MLFNKQFFVIYILLRFFTTGEHAADVNKHAIIFVVNALPVCNHVFAYIDFFSYEK